MLKTQGISLGQSPDPNNAQKLIVIVEGD